MGDVLNLPPYRRPGTLERRLADTAQITTHFERLVSLLEAAGYVCHIQCLASKALKREASHNFYSLTLQRKTSGKDAVAFLIVHETDAKNLPAIALYDLLCPFARVDQASAGTPSTYTPTGVVKKIDELFVELALKQE
jgi:hypothetical protein